MGDVVPGRYTARLFIGDSSADVELAVRPDSLTQILVGFGSQPVEQRFHALASLDASAFPFGPDGRVKPPPFGEFDEPPQVIYQAPPVYPDMARMAEIEGVVLVQVGVDETGDVVEAEVVQGVPGLNEAAVDAVMQWKFRPARRAGHPVRVRIVVPVRFTLRG